MQNERAFGRLLLLVCITVGLVLIACSKKDMQEEVQTPAKIPEESVTPVTAQPSNIGGEWEGQKEKLASKITSDTMASEELLPVSMQKLDDMLQKELDSEKYTFKDPFVVQDPYQNSPLSAVVIFNTKKERGVRVTVKGDDAESDVTGQLNTSTSHRVPVIGLYAGRVNTVILELLDKNNAVVDSKELKIQTDALPASMEDLVRVEKSEENTAYPLTIISGMATPFPFAYDHNGAVRWYISSKTEGYGVFPLSNNRFIFQYDNALTPTEEKPHTTQMFEMDYLGRVHQIYYVKNGYHHEVIEKVPNGNLLLLSSSIDGHVEDTVQELDRETGSIVKTLDMREIFGMTYVDRIDWAHLNTVSYKEADDSILLSPRNLHSGIKVNWIDNQLKWILCNPKFWKDTAFKGKVLKPKGEIVWFYQPHSIYEIPHDLDNNPNTVHIMVYDNHWHKSRKVEYFDKLKESFVSFFTINEKEMTVKQDRLYPSLKSKITSNCAFDYEAKRVFSFGGCLDPAVNGRKGIAYEYDYKSGKILNQYSIKYLYYRGYQMVIDYNDCARPMNIGTNYVKGVLQAPIKAENLDVPGETFTSTDVSFVLKESILYMTANDHAVMQVDFVGSHNTYRVDYSSAFPGERKYRNLKYEHTIPLAEMSPDVYQIIIHYRGSRYNTGQQITVNP